MRYCTLVARLLVTAAVFAQGIALSAQPRAGRNDLEIRPLQNAPLTAVLRRASPAAAPAPNIPLQLAGLPGAGAAPGKRIFLTVREDVYQNGRLFIAAGARAKGLIRAIRYNDTTLYLGLELQTVQTADGPLVKMTTEPLELEVALADSGARHWAFEAPLAPEQRLIGETAGLFWR